MAKQGARDRANELKKKAELRKISEMRANLAKQSGERSVLKKKLDEARKGLAAAKDKRDRARKKKVLQHEMEGVRKADAVTRRLIKPLKVAEVAVEAASWLGPGGPAAKGATKLGKAALKKAADFLAKRTPKKPVKITPTSKFAERTIKSKSREIVKGTGKGKPVHLEQTIVKGKKPTTVRSTPNKPTLSNRTRVGAKGGAAPKAPSKKEGYNRMREHLKKAAERNKKLEKFLPKDAPKTSAKNIQKVKEAKKAFDKGFSASVKSAIRKGVKKAAPKKASSTKKPFRNTPKPKPTPKIKRGPALKVDKGSKYDKRTKLSALKEQATKRAKSRAKTHGKAKTSDVLRGAVKKKATAKAPAKKPATKRKPKGGWKDPDLGAIVKDINRKRQLPKKMDSWEVPTPKRKKPRSGGRGRK